ncbi:MAG TPA: AAA family ATPase [Candidatus Binatia bacterium]|nr:AAA family ATPase [Candidatus Binatia bacterium]
MLRTVIIDSDPEAQGALRRLLAASPAVAVVGEFGSLQESMAEAAARRPDLVIAEVPVRPGEADLGRGTKAMESLVRAVPDAAIFATGPALPAEAVIQLMRAGAIEVLTRPVEREALLGALDKVLRLRRSAAPARQAGRIVSVFSTKGGLGVTTMASNLAVCLAEHAPERVALIDLDTRQSDIATHLNLRPTYSVLDALESLDRLDESFLQGLMVKHPSGLLVLPGPTRIERAQLGGEQVRVALDSIRAHFAHVVIDLRHDLDGGTIAALEASDTIFFLTSLDVCTLRSSAAGLAAFRHLGLNLQRVQVVVMREDTAEDVTLKHARDTLGVAVSWKTPSDYPAVVASINSGQPVVSAAPRSRIARNLRQLAATLLPPPASRRGAAALARLLWTPKGSTGD